MARAVELLGLRACLVQSTMDCGEGLPASWAVRTTDDCIQVGSMLISSSECLIIILWFHSFTCLCKCIFYT